MAVTINGIIKYTTALLVVILLTQFKYTYTKSCKLKRNLKTRTYFLSCDSSFSETDSERSPSTSINRKKDKKNKRGPPGEQGPQGPPGRDGEDGIQGPEGPMGPTGPTGVPGPRGHKGKHGPKGVRGDGGPIGPQGKTGLPGNCLKEPPMYNKKTQESYHCLAGPQGPQGTKGNTGPKGKDGTSGPKGPQGNDGPEGTRGRRGPSGMPGLPGTAARIECQDQFTEWFSQYKPIDANSIDGFFCSKGQFLQGFKRERNGLQERYHYVCCGLV